MTKEHSSSLQEKKESQKENAVSVCKKPSEEVRQENVCCQKVRESERAACDSRVANLMGAVPEQKPNVSAKYRDGWNACRQALISADKSYAEGNGV